MRNYQEQSMVLSYAKEQADIARQQYHRILESEQAQQGWEDVAATLGETRLGRLRGDALALCGSPHHVLSHARWSQEAWKFLALFCE